MDKDDQDESPLKAEAEKRKEWRGEGTELDEGAALGHSLPASEAGSGSEGGSEGGRSPMRTIRPPD